MTPRRSTVVTLGVFDGVHRGHQLLAQRTIAAARERGGRSVAVTFHPHPMAVVAPERAPEPLTTLERRVALLDATGLDDVVVLDFTPERAAQEPEAFVGEVLRERLDAGLVVVGADWRFGRKAAGDVDLLRRLGYDVDAVELLATTPDGEPVSSSRIRHAVGQGDVTVAADMLTRPHLVEGPVVKGEQRGRGLGYPTANIAVSGRVAVPADGVYAGILTRADGTALPAAVSIGTNPTFEGARSRSVEAYVMDHGHDLDLYDEQVTLGFAERLREMTRFEGVTALVEQMARDVDAARRALAAVGPLGATPPLH